MKTTIIGMLLSPFLLMGQQNSGAWTNIGLSPAAVEAIVVDPRGTGTIFMGTVAGGIRKSVDDGITWSAANTGLTDLEVTALAMDASGPQTVYAGVFGVGGGLFKTSDGGATWKIMPATGGVASVAADPNRSGVVYAAVFNTADFPAKVGAVISLYVTGLGQTGGPMIVTIGGQPAISTFLGKVAGATQMDLKIPDSIQTGSAVPVVVQVENTSSQAGVTIAVR